MRVKGYVAGLTLGVALALSSGCEWSSGGGASSWSDSYNWVNFSGTYRGIGGGVLVTDYSTTPGTTATTNSVDGERAGTGSTATTYSGTLSHGSLVAGSLKITVGSWTFSDDGAGGLSAGSDTSGSVGYGTGSWSINLNGQHPGVGDAILASYQYTVAGSSGSGGAGSGVSGATIYSFVVWQSGEVLQITDNNGKVYNGTMGSISGSMNASSNNAVIGDSIVAQFSAEGVSAANYQVTIAGTLQGVVGGASGATYLNNRQMFGTWMEDGGRTGDINGEASPIVVTTTATTTTTE